MEHRGCDSSRLRYRANPRSSVAGGWSFRPASAREGRLPGLPPSPAGDGVGETTTSGREEAPDRVGRTTTDLGLADYLQTPGEVPRTRIVRMGHVSFSVFPWLWP